MRTKLAASLSIIALIFFTVMTGLLVAAQSPATDASRTRPRKASPQTLPPRAQAPDAAPPRAPASSSSQSSQAKPAPAGDADLSITAHVTARELRFEKVPNPSVEFNGKPLRETVWEAQRENLPAQVRPGETYRNIGITLRITSVFADIDRIVAEALGEIPASDDASPRQPQQHDEQPQQIQLPSNPYHSATPQEDAASPQSSTESPSPTTATIHQLNSTNTPRARIARKKGGK